MTMAVKRVVIAVFDGLRPDHVDPGLMPDLHRFATSGTWFRAARSVFPSMTRVATTSFATGSRPQSHGIVHNAFFDPAIEGGWLDTARASHLDAAQAHHGRFVEAEGLGCALAAAGRRFAVVHGGSAGSARLVSHRAAELGHWTFSIHGRDHTQTPHAVDAAVGRFGALPRSDGIKRAEADYATRVLTELVLPEVAPDVALIWLSEPDTIYHYGGIGSADARAALTHVDGCFGRILDAVAADPLADETLVVAMSDHGQITTTGVFDLAAALTARGFVTAHAPGPQVDVLMVPGSTAGLTLAPGREHRLQELADLLMGLEETGLLFCRGDAQGRPAVEGAFHHALVGADHPRAPDLYWVARSHDDPDGRGQPGAGLFTAGVDVPVGGGMHGGLNRFELNTMLTFGGAGVPALGVIDDAADLTAIAPTVLALMGVERPATMTGRPLAAMIGAPRRSAAPRRLETGSGAFRQHLVVDGDGVFPVVLSGGRD
jgi:phosphonoacetate hydrolase